MQMKKMVSFCKDMATVHSPAIPCLVPLAAYAITQICQCDACQ